MSFFFQLVLKINDTFESKRGKKRVKLQPYTGKEAPSSKGKSHVYLSVCSITIHVSFLLLGPAYLVGTTSGWGDLFGSRFQGAVSVMSIHSSRSMQQTRKQLGGSQGRGYILLLSARPSLLKFPQLHRIVPAARSKHSNQTTIAHEGTLLHNLVSD